MKTCAALSLCCCHGDVARQREPTRTAFLRLNNTGRLASQNRCCLAHRGGHTAVRRRTKEQDPLLNCRQIPPKQTRCCSIQARCPANAGGRVIPLFCFQNLTSDLYKQQSEFCRSSNNNETLTLFRIIFFVIWLSWIHC